MDASLKAAANVEFSFHPHQVLQPKMYSWIIMDTQVFILANLMSHSKNANSLKTRKVEFSPANAQTHISTHAHSQEMIGQHFSLKHNQKQKLTNAHSKTMFLLLMFLVKLL